MNSQAFELHLVTPQTAPLLNTIADDVFDHPVRPEFLQEFLACPSNVLVVARTEGCVVGMASGLTYLHPDKPRSLFINEVGVAAGFRRRGIARALIRRILDWGRERGCVEAWVATETSNAPARRLYEATGGVEDPEPAVVFLYSLTAHPSAASPASTASMPCAEDPCPPSSQDVAKARRA